VALFFSPVKPRPQNRAALWALSAALIF